MKKNTLYITSLMLYLIGNATTTDAQPNTSGNKPKVEFVFQLSDTNKHIFSRKRNFYLAGIEPDKIQQIDSNPIFNEVKNIGIVMGLRYLNSFMSRFDYLFPQLIV